MRRFGARGTTPCCARFICNIFGRRTLSGPLMKPTTPTTAITGGERGMTPTEFRERLETVARRTGLTASDLAVWFGRPRPTVRTWLNGRTPRRVPQAHIGGQVWDEMQQRLLWLERAFSVAPEGFRPKRDYLKTMFNHERLRSVRESRPPVEGDPRF